MKWNSSANNCNAYTRVGRCMCVLLYDERRSALVHSPVRALRRPPDAWIVRKSSEESGRPNMSRERREEMTSSTLSAACRCRLRVPAEPTNGKDQYRRRVRRPVVSSRTTTLLREQRKDTCECTNEPKCLQTFNFLARICIDDDNKHHFVPSWII